MLYSLWDTFTNIMCSVSAVCSQLQTTLLKKKQSKTVRKFLVIAFNHVTCITKTDRLKWVPMGSAQNACSPVRKLQLFCQSVAVVCSLEVFRCNIHPRCQGSFLRERKTWEQGCAWWCSYHVGDACCSRARKCQYLCPWVAMGCNLQHFQVRNSPGKEFSGNKKACSTVGITWESPAVHVLGNVNIYVLRLPWDTVFNIFRCEILRKNRRCNGVLWLKRILCS